MNTLNIILSSLVILLFIIIGVFATINILEKIKSKRLIKEAKAEAERIRIMHQEARRKELQKELDSIKEDIENN